MSSDKKSPNYDLSRITRIVQKMREGDVDAVALLFDYYPDVIRHRILRSMVDHRRKEIDSNAIASIRARLTRLVATGQFTAKSERQFWSLLFRMAMEPSYDRLRKRLLKNCEWNIVLTDQLLTYFERSKEMGGEFSTDLKRMLEGIKDEKAREEFEIWLLEKRVHFDIDEEMGLGYANPELMRAAWEAVFSWTARRIIEMAQLESTGLQELLYSDLFDLSADALEFEVEVPADADLGMVRRHLLRIAECADSLHRELGGRGLRVDSIESGSNVRVGVPQ